MRIWTLLTEPDSVGESRSAPAPAPVAEENFGPTLPLSRSAANTPSQMERVCESFKHRFGRIRALCERFQAFAAVRVSSCPEA